MRCAGARPAAIAWSASAVSPVRATYSGPSWTASSGSASSSPAPGGLHTVTATVALRGRLAISSSRIRPAAARALPELSAGPADDAGGNTRRRARRDVPVAVRRGLERAAVTRGLRPVLVALDEFRAAAELLLELRLDLVRRPGALPTARGGTGQRDDHHRQRR